MTKMYRTKLRIIVPIEVEAESMDEAKRIIDGVLNNVSGVTVFEGDREYPEDEFTGKPARLERDDIEIVTPHAPNPKHDM